METGIDFLMMLKMNLEYQDVEDEENLIDTFANISNAFPLPQPQENLINTVSNVSAPPPHPIPSSFNSTR